MEDWVLIGAADPPHSEEYAEAFHRSLVDDEPAIPFSNARLFAEHYGALRERALERPTGVGDTLIPKPALWPAESGDFTNFTRLPKATLPPAILPAIKRPHLPLPSDVKFRIVECLSIGLHRMSQTFKAKIVSSQELGERTVVLKIAQDSLAKNSLLWPPAAPEVLRWWENAPPPADWKSLWHDAATETAAYEYLEVLQGTVLPWFFGAFSFDLPCGETAFGLVLEYLEAPTLEDITLSTGGFHSTMHPHLIKRCQNALRACLKAMYSFNRCGVFHGDTATRNFIVHEDGENTVAYILDLGQSVPACCPGHATGDMDDACSLFSEWGLDLRWQAEVADALHFRISGVNWDISSPELEGMGLALPEVE